MDGEFWTITYDGVTVRLKQSRGLTFLAALLREPGREIAATELAERSASDVRTGTLCCYAPDPRAPIAWET